MANRSNGPAMPHPIDVHVGERLRKARQLRKLSQRQLASELGVVFQQIQKFEMGLNRISAGRLFDLSLILSVPIGYFYCDAKDSLVPACKYDQVLCLDLTELSEAKRDAVISLSKLPEGDARAVQTFLSQIFRGETELLN
ncbi:MAG: helix-turn-helix transcriptional regulator [Pseudomonadota bacterium]